MNYSYIILDDDTKSILKIKSVMDSFSNFTLLATATNYNDALDKVLEHQPDFIFLEINPISTTSNLSLLFINELHRYLKKVPKVIAISHDSTKAFDALKYDVLDFLIKPFLVSDVRKALLRFEKTCDTPVIRLNPNPRILQEEKIDDIEVNEALTFENLERKSELECASIQNNHIQEDWIIQLKNEISSLKEAILELGNSDKPIMDTSTIVEQISTALENHLPKEQNAFDIEPILTEIKLLSQKTIETNLVKEEVQRNLICIKSYGDYRFLELDEIAFLKADNNSTDITMQNGEVVIAFKTLKYFEENLPENFFRIHNSYIVNKNYVSRVHTGNTVCYIKKSKTQLPFSKSYKENVEHIVSLLAGTDFKDI
jgi:DNA-binding LytR/AlgR family response regulator